TTTESDLGDPVESKSLPVATRLPSRACSVAENDWGAPSGAAAPEPLARFSKTAWRSQYAAGTNRMRSRSRSPTMRVATLWTRPADRLGPTFFQSTGDTS